MKKKIGLLAMALLFASCSVGGTSSSEGYVIDDGEVVINDKELLNPTATNDNYRVFYEIFTGSFSDSNGDGIGDLQGIINRLDYLNDGDPNSGKSLGVQGIWLTPIFKSPTYHKYDVTDYYEIDPDFGDMEVFKKLIDECHKRDIKVIIDFVINHTGDKNEWFEKFKNAHILEDPSSIYYDFYSYIKPGETATNGRIFQKVFGADVSYECNFSSNMPELNFDNDAVKTEVLEIAKHYLDMGVDGFRFDAAKYIYYGDHIKSAEFWKWFTDELRKIKSDIYIVGEVWDGDGITDGYIEKGLDCFNFTCSQAEGKIAAAAKQGAVTVFTKYVETYTKHLKELNENAMMMSFISNHDMDRSAGYLQMSNRLAHMAASMYILSPGSPFIYYGEEIGIKGSRGGANTDANRRLAMRWGDGDTIANPSEATYKEKLQINGTVVDHLANELSLANHYKKLIMIRKAHPEIARGEYTSINTNIPETGGFISTYNNSTVGVFHNVSVNQIEIDLSSLSLSFNKLNAFAGNKGATLKDNILIIPAQTTVVLR